MHRRNISVIALVATLVAIAFIIIEVGWFNFVFYLYTGGLARIILVILGLCALGVWTIVLIPKND